MKSPLSPDTLTIQQANLETAKFCLKVAWFLALVAFGIALGIHNW